jgi:hypothetical protein
VSEAKSVWPVILFFVAIVAAYWFGHRQGYWIRGIDTGIAEDQMELYGACYITNDDNITWSKPWPARKDGSCHLEDKP